MKWLVFDVDGVLLDVSKSYDMATKLTVEYFFRKIGRDDKLELKVVDELRRKGAFGDDYKLTEALLCDNIDAIPSGATIEWIRDTYDPPFSSEEIRPIFDTYYLGEMGEDPQFDFDGLWKKEETIIDIELLEEVESRFELGAVTGRCDLEMRLAEGIIGYEFKKKVTSDDYLKPDPRALKSLVGDESGLFIGDSKTDELLVERYNERYDGRFDFIMVKRDVNEAVRGLL